MLTYNGLNNIGRLANQLFALAATIGFAEKYKQEYVLPEWKYSQYFKNKLPVGRINTSPVKEKCFEYHDLPQLKDGDHDLYGYFQSEKFFEHCKHKVRFALEWKDGLKLKYKPHDIAVHIRRGDYVNNPNYMQLSVNYYLSALGLIEDWHKKSVLILSDDINYCRFHFGSHDNITFANGNEIEDLCAMSQCNNFVLSNSSYSWWGAWLGEKKDSIIIRPDGLFDGDLLKQNDSKDFYPERWIKHEAY